MVTLVNCTCQSFIKLISGYNMAVNFRHCGPHQLVHLVDEKRELNSMFCEVEEHEIIIENL